MVLKRLLTPATIIALALVGSSVTNGESRTRSRRSRGKLGRGRSAGAVGAVRRLGGDAGDDDLIFRRRETEVQVVGRARVDLVDPQGLGARAGHGGDGVGPAGTQVLGVVDAGRVGGGGDRGAGRHV